MSTISEQKPSRNVSGVLVGHVAVVALVVAWFWYSGDLENRSGYWAGMTIAAVAVSAGLVAVAVLDARRDAGSGTAPVASTLAVVVGVIGMFLYLLVWIGVGTACEGTSAACSWECLNASSWQSLSVLAVLAATVAVPTLLVVSRQIQSRAVARAAPSLVIALFIVATLLDTPHGSNEHCAASALPRPACGSTVTVR